MVATQGRVNYLPCQCDIDKNEQLQRNPLELFLIPV